MKTELKQYEVEPEPLWQSTWRYGDGYSLMGAAETRQWHAIGCWGRDGYDLGSWPLVIVFFRDHDDEGKYDLVYYVEGDTWMYTCPTKEIRNAVCDELAFFHWKNNSEKWVEGYESVEQLPAELRGPYRTEKEEVHHAQE